MGELQAEVEGCRVSVSVPEGAEVSPAVRAALAELAEAMYETQLGESEVSGFGLGIGDLGLSSGAGANSFITRDCWPFYGGSCGWYTRDEGDGEAPGSCSIYAVNKKGL